ncbi:MAG: hypothetical protein DGJ47_000860 [Rickettsiaceae bacterium]
MEPLSPFSTALDCIISSSLLLCCGHSILTAIVGEYDDEEYAPDQYEDFINFHELVEANGQGMYHRQSEDNTIEELTSSGSFNPYHNPYQNESYHVENY